MGKNRTSAKAAGRVAVSDPPSRPPLESRSPMAGDAYGRGYSPSINGQFAIDAFVEMWRKADAGQDPFSTEGS